MNRKTEIKQQFSDLVNTRWTQLTGSLSIVQEHANVGISRPYAMHEEGRYPRVLKKRMKGPTCMTSSDENIICF